MTPDRLAIAHQLARTIASRYGRLYRADPADFVQEGLAAVVTHIHRYDPARGTWRAFCRTYLRAGMSRYGMYGGRMIRYSEHAIYRARRDRRELPPDPVHFADLGLHAGPVDYADPTPNAEDVLHDHDRARTVRAAVDALPARQRDVVRAMFWGEMDGAAVARSIGGSKQSVNLTWHRARTALAEVLR